MGIFRKVADFLYSADTYAETASQWARNTCAAICDVVIDAYEVARDTVMDFVGNAKVVLAPMAKTVTGITFAAAFVLEVGNGVAHACFDVGIPAPVSHIIFGLATIGHAPHLVHWFKTLDHQQMPVALMFMSRAAIVGLTIWLMVATGSVFWPAMIGFIALTIFTIPLQLACLLVWFAADLFSALAFCAKRVADAMSVVATAMERGDKELGEKIVNLFRRRKVQVLDLTTDEG